MIVCSLKTPYEASNGKYVTHGAITCRRRFNKLNNLAKVKNRVEIPKEQGTQKYKERNKKMWNQISSRHTFIFPNFFFFFFFCWMEQFRYLLGVEETHRASGTICIGVDRMFSVHQSLASYISNDIFILNRWYLMIWHLNHSQNCKSILYLQTSTHSLQTKWNDIWWIVTPMKKMKNEDETKRTRKYGMNTNHKYSWIFRHISLHL